MVSFGEQLKILLWKNWTLRKRNTLRIVIEILWPLALFLILMWVRTRGLKYKRANCHLIEKALPSVGGFEFFQNFVCTLNNTCYDSDVELVSSTKRWENASLIKFMRETNPILEDILSSESTRAKVGQLWGLAMAYFRLISGYQRANDLRTLGSVKLRDLLKKEGEEAFLSRVETYTGLSKEIGEDFLSVSINLDKLQSENVQAVISDIQNEQCDKSKTYELLIFPSKKAFEELCSLSREKMYMLLFLYRTYVDRSGLFKKLTTVIDSDNKLKQAQGNLSFTDFETLLILGQLQELGTHFLDLGRAFQGFRNLSGPEMASLFIYDGLCGENQSGNGNRTLFSVDPGESNRFDSLRDRLKDWNPDHQYEIDNEISPACNAIFQRLESMPISSFIWRQVKPLIRGYIYYAPDNEMTRLIMEKVEKGFLELKDLERSVNAMLQLLHRLRLWIHENLGELYNLQLFLGNRANVEIVFNLLGIPVDTDAVNRIKDVAESMSTINLEKAMERMDFIYELISEISGCIRYNKSVPFETEHEAVSAGHELLSNEKLWAVLVFSNLEDGNLTENGTMPSHIYYKIRMDSDKVDGTRAIRDRLTSKGPRRRPLFDLKYITYGFIYLQEMVERAIIEIVTNEDISKEEVYLQQYPYPCYIYDQFIRAISRTFPLFMVLSWVYASAMIVKSVVLEKERRLREVMKIMGVSNLAVWTSWFIESFIIMFISSSVLTIILKYGKVMEFSSPTLIWFFLISYTVATICFSFLISTFFSRANSAAAAGGVIFFVSYLPYNMMLLWEERLAWFETLSGCLISNVAFGFGCTYFARFEQDGIGAQWDNLSTKSLPDDEFNLVYCIMMMWFDAVFYSILTWYIEAVFPGEYGIPNRWNFFLAKSYWVPPKTVVGSQEKLNINGVNGDADASTVSVSIRIFESSDQTSENIEDEPEGVECGVRIINLSKKYRNGKQALDNLSINFYENQITSFLGHNGAGKTTTISILTGLFTPSKGTAYINGMDIRTDMNRIRRNLGICPQFNVLFDRLNVLEHLRFYALLKGKKGPEVEAEFDQILEDLGIPHKRFSYPSSLSGGMKRKLSVAIAFVGGSRTVFLDEPTSGVDPYSRRSIWELLLKYKAGRTVILTTHFMDEADILGDRIAIISQGKLKALGSSLFLKSHFGQGYTLHLVKTENFNRNVPDSEAVLKQDERIEKFVTKIIPSAVITENVGSEIAFLLPYSEIKKFSDLFTKLEENLDRLGVLSFGISDTSLEDVFLKITVDDLAANAESFHALSSTCKRRFMQILSNCKNKRLPRNEVGTIAPQPLPNGSPNMETPNLAVLHPVPHRDEMDTGYSSSASAIPETNSVGIPFCKDKSVVSSEITTTSGDTATATTSLLDETVGDEEECAPLPRFGLNRALSLVCCGCPCFVQIYMIVWKRLNNSLRNKKAVFFEIILPAVFIAITLAFTLILPPATDEPAREVTPWVYPSPNNFFFAEPQISKKKGRPSEFKTFLNELIGPIGMGTACLEDQRKEICHRTQWNNQSVQEFNNSRLQFKGLKFKGCDCNVGTLSCPKEDNDPIFPKLKTQTNDFILDVSDTNIASWILRSYDKYLDMRYGGFELQLRKKETPALISYLSLLENLTSLLPLPILKDVEGRDIFESDLGEIEDKGIRTKLVYKVWYENRGWLSSIAYLNALHNTWLRGKLPEGEQKEKFGITLMTHPMNLTKSQSSKESLKTAGVGVIHAICVIFALSFIPASFTVYLIEERKCGGKHLHLVSGVKPITYWIGNFTYDMLKYIIPVALCLLLFLVFDAQAYIGKESILAFLSLLLLYGWASIPAMYPFSFVFGIPSTAFVVLACSNLFIGVITTVSTFVLEQFGDKELEEIGKILKKVFLIFPHYCLGRGCMDLVRLHIEETAISSFVSKSGMKEAANRFAWKWLGEKLFYLAIHGMVYFLINLMVEYRYLPFLLCRRRRKPIPMEEDEDVLRERDRVQSAVDTSSMTLAALNLTKYYKRRGPPAVNGITFGIGKGQCFGLLGVNGAGKSTTFKMLTGDVRLSSGKAKICGANIETNLDTARTHFGYCPQEDSIDPLLTGYELLTLYGRLRGLSSSETYTAAARLIKTLGLTRYANRSSGTYSGGNKRKLSTGIALIGDPDVIFLDEPTSGMDPGARRDLWKVILDLLHKGKTVVLTSHSMEECEVLCTKIAIMVNGQFKCLGSLQHLKNRFGKGYTLTIRCVEKGQDELLKIIEEDLPQATVEDQHCSQIKLNIPQESAQLSEIFKTLSEYKIQGKIEDYSVSQTTLDDIFVRFASQQMDSLDRPQGIWNNK